MDVQTILCWRMCRPCQSPWLSWKHSSGITLLLLEWKQFPSILGSSDSRVPFQRSSWTIMFFCSSVSTRENSSASFLEEENGWKTLPPVLTLTFANGNLSTNTPLEENVTKMPVKYKRHSKTLRICSIAIAIVSFLKPQQGITAPCAAVCNHHHSASMTQRGDLHPAGHWLNIKSNLHASAKCGNRNRRPEAVKT